MKNFIQRSDVITVVAPAGGLTSGQGYRLNGLFGVVAYDAAQGEQAELHREGVYSLPKLSTDVVAGGDVLYWDVGNGRLTTTASTHKAVGVAAAAAGNGVANVALALVPNTLDP